MVDDDNDSSPSLAARLSATIRASLRGDEPGLLVTGVLSLILCFGGLWFESVHPSIWSEIVILVGLAGFVMVLYRWNQRGSNRLCSEGIPIEVGVSETEVIAKTMVQTPRQAIAFIREVVQNRGNPTPPHGEVAGTPGSPKALREYSDEERNRVTQELLEGIRRHDEKIIRQAGEIELQLPAPGSPSDAPQDN